MLTMASDKKSLLDVEEELDDLDRQIQAFIKTHPELKSVSAAELRKYPWLNKLIEKEKKAEARKKQLKGNR
jgi:hypothetical protein